MKVLSQQIQNYLSGEKFYLEDKLWLVYSNLGIHWSELPLEMLRSCGTGILERIGNGVQHLKKNGRYEKIKEYLYAIDRSAGWYMNDQDLERFMSYKFTKEEVLTVYFENIDDNFINKRDFRIHLHEVVPLTIYYHKTGFENYSLELLSASKGGLIFFCDDRLQGKIMKGYKLEMMVQPQLFLDINMLIDDAINIDTKQTSELTWHFIIDSSQIQFTTSKLFAAVEGCPYIRYLFVPYTAFKDSLDVGLSCLGDSVNHCLEEIEHIAIPNK